MSALFLSPRLVRTRASALALAVGYSLVGGLVMAWLAPRQGVVWAPGLLFVGVSAAVFYLTLRWWGSSLDAAHARLDLLLRQVPGLLWTTGRDLRFQSVAGGGAGLGAVLEALRGHPVDTLVEVAPAREALRAAHQRALQGEAADLEIEVRGTAFVARVEPFRTEGRIVGCAAFALEIQRGLSDEAVGVRDTLERSRVLATVGALVLEVGHQMMNPLFAMSSALDALDARVGRDPATQRHRTLLRTQVQRVTGLVSGLQEYGRLGEVETRPCDIGDLLRRLAGGWREHAEEFGVAVVVEAPPAGELEMNLDPDSLSRALGHLVTNACQHSPAGTSVRVSAGTVDGVPGSLRLDIDDEGPGFLAEVKDLATTPLTARRPGGAGLGLAIAERIVQLHGGRLELEEAPTGGARIIVVIDPAV